MHSIIVAWPKSLRFVIMDNLLSIFWFVYRTLTVNTVLYVVESIRSQDIDYMPNTGQTSITNLLL